MTDRKLGLDYVRAVAILSVVICHTLAIWLEVDPALAYPPGVLGVELFFVLSGYLIGGIFLKAVRQANGVITPGLVTNFWARRWLRTVPNYLLFLVVFRFAQPPKGDVPLVPYLTFTQNLAWPISSFYAVSWSLSVEEWFYLIFPGVALALFAACRRAKWSILGSALTLFFIPPVLRVALGTGGPWDEGTRKIVVYRLDALMWGVLLAAVSHYRPDWFRALQRRGVAGLGVVSGAAACVWVGGRYAAGDNSDFTARTSDAFIFCLFSLSAALVIPAAVAARGIHPVVDGFATRTSHWSYSMYLAHLPVIFWVGGLAAEVTVIPNKAWLVGAWVAIYAASAAAYYLFELPLLRLRDRWTGRQEAAAGRGGQDGRASAAGAGARPG